MVNEEDYSSGINGSENNYIFSYNLLNSVLNQEETVSSSLNVNEEAIIEVLYDSHTSPVAPNNVGENNNLSTTPLAFSDWSIYKGFKAPGTRWPGGFHFGLDLLSKKGGTLNAPVGAFITGKVYSINYWKEGDTKDSNPMGNAIILQHTDKYGNIYYTSYQHLNSILDTIKKGDTIDAGQLIGYAGATGNASGPHLHFDLYFRGSYPSRYFFSNKCQVSWGNILYYYMNPKDFGAR